MKWLQRKSRFIIKFAPSTIKGKLTFGFLSLSLAPILAIGILSYQYARTALEKEIINKLHAVADNKSFILKSWFQDQLSDSQKLASNLAFRDLLSPYYRIMYPELAAKTPEERRQRAKNLIVGLQESSPFYIDVMLSDQRGKVLLSSSEALNRIGKNLTEIGLAKIELDRTYVSPVFSSQDAQLHVFMITSPVFDDNGAAIGHVILEAELRPIQRLVEERSGLGETGEVVIIDRTRRMLTQSRFTKESTIFKAVPDMKLISLGLQGEKGESFHQDYRGVSVFSTFRPLSEIDSVLVAKIDASEGFAPVAKLRNLALAIVVFTILIVIWVSVKIARSISNPIREGVGLAHRVSEGDLTVTLSGRDTTEMGMLADSLNQMVENLSQMVSRITQIVQNLSASATEMSSAAEQQERNVASQASSINEITTTIQELAQSSNQMGKTSEDVSTQWEESLQIIENGLQAVQKGTGEMNLSKIKTEGITQNIINLSEQTQRINSFVHTVTNIAEQTNMLALNAGIEAARAGEHGRGFAVVATEVRKLADQSQKAAGQIGAIIQEIQGATHNTILAVEEGTKGVDAGVQHVLQAEETLQAVTATIKQTVGSVQEISLAAKQQAIGVDQVSEAMRIIDQGMKGTVAGTKETHGSASHLVTMGQSLHELVKKFQVTNGDRSKKIQEQTRT